ncbi:MAG: hypothetical protein AAF830_00945 [Pseudomonadota bacterium]
MRLAAVLVSGFFFGSAASAAELAYENNSDFDTSLQQTLASGSERVEIDLGDVERVPMRIRRWLGAMTNQGGALRTCFTVPETSEWNPGVLNIAGQSDRYNAIAGYSAIIEADPTNQTFSGVVLVKGGSSFNSALSEYPKCPAG